ncbi:unnamed protein product [Closterium sp. NIES-64]|nr:unnamed protein product [Closterium sp. NIES-64]
MARVVNATAACHDATRLPQLQPPGNTSSAQHAHSLTMPVHLLCTLAHEILDEARFTLYSVYEALGITLGRLVGVDQFGVQLEGLREQLEAARGELAAHKNLITRQAQELAAARGEVAEQSSRMLKVGALEEALVSLTRGDWGSTHTLNQVMEHVKHLTAFQKLDMMGCRVADGGVQRLSNLPSLTHIMTDQRSLQ